MANGKAIRRKLQKKVIGKLGLNTKLLRISETVEKDAYGEPLDRTTAFEEFDIRIVVDTDKRDNEKTDIGGLPGKKEYILFYCAGDYDVRSGDKIIYPANSNTEWEVDKIEPTMINDIPVIIEIKACRDARY